MSRPRSPGGPPRPAALLTRAETAAILGTGREAVSRMARAGSLASVRTPGGRRRYIAAQVRRLAAARGHQAAPPPRLRSYIAAQVRRLAAAVRAGRLPAPAVTSSGPVTRRDPDGRRHGRASTYNTHGCRCAPCRAAASAVRARWVASLQDRPFSDVPHGTASGYRNWGCRCPACTAVRAAESRAVRAAESRQRERRRAAA